MSEWMTQLHAVSAVLTAGRRKAKTLCVSDRRDLPSSILSLAQKIGLPIQAKAPKDLDRLTEDGRHQGIALEVEGYPYVSFNEILNASPKFILALDRVQDPQNVGAILRSAYGFQVDGVLLSRDHGSPITPAVVRASAGASEFLPIAQVSGLAQHLSTLKKNGLWVIGADMGGTALGQSRILGEPLVLVMGAEGKGLRESIHKACDEILSIPMRANGVIDSLNVSVSAGVILWEMAKAKALLRLS